jgi:hypothetical protein
MSCTILSVGLVFAPVANAGNWFGNSGYSAVCATWGNMTDNKDVYFSYIDPSADLSQATNWVRSNLLNPTSLDTFYVSDPTDATDVIMRDRYYTDWCEDTLGVQWTTNGVTGLMGFAACYRTTGGGRCDQQVVRISNHWFDNRGDAGDRWLVCHEVGHAIGLRHRDTGQGCMLNTGEVGSREYTDHDRSQHINASWS